MKQIILLLMLLLTLGTRFLAQAQLMDPTALTQNIDMYIDKLGDAKMELSMKMDASQWNMFISSEYAKNKSLFRRDMEREMMWVQIDDIDMHLDDKNRIATATMSVKNMASYSGDNLWTLKMGGKDVSLNKISDNCYLMTNNIVSEDGGIIQQLQKFIFPAGATNVRQDSDRYGNTVILYDLPVREAGMTGGIAIIGIILILLGGLWLLWQQVGQHLAKKVFKQQHLHAQNQHENET